MYDPVKPQSLHHLRHHKRSCRRQEAKRWGHIIQGFGTISPRLAAHAQEACSRRVPFEMYADYVERQFALAERLREQAPALAA
jgi:hypothetical protein